MHNTFAKIEKGQASGKKLLFIGGFNQDIQMQAHRRLISGDSVPGIIKRSPGGVVRNIAENSSLLGLDCSLLSICGDDDAGESILKRTESTGVNCSPCVQIENESTCIYSALLNEEGDMIYAVNQMDLIKKLTPSFFESRKVELEKQDFFILDTNLPRESLEYICINYPKKILLIDPVSTEKFKRLKGLLSYVDIIKPNRIEASSYTGIDLETDADYFNACEKLIEEGANRVFISSGSRGIFSMDEKEKALIPPLKLNPLSVTGAGDAASAALVLAGLSRLSISEASWFANLSAAASLLSSRAINENLSINLLKNISKEYEYEKQLS